MDIKILMDMKVQHPPEGPFTRDVLEWHSNNLAHIPAERFLDFLIGEQNRLETPTIFYIKKSWHNAPGSLRRISEDSYTEKKSYQCAFGPEVGVRTKIKDVVQNEENTHKRKRKDTIKRGCLCRFEYRKLYLHPEVVRITYEELRHVNSEGLPCHGAIDPSSLHKRYQFAPFISQDLKEWVFARLESRATTAQIMAEHRENVMASMQKEGLNYQKSRDDFLKMSDIHNIVAAIRKGKWRVDEEKLSGRLSRTKVSQTRMSQRMRSNSGAPIGERPRGISFSTEDSLCKGQQDLQDTTHATEKVVDTAQSINQSDWAVVESRLRTMVAEDPSLRQDYTSMLLDVEKTLKRIQTDHHRKMDHPGTYVNVRVCNSIELSDLELETQ